MADHELAEALDRLMNSPADLHETLIALGRMRYTNLDALAEAVLGAISDIED